MTPVLRLETPEAVAEIRPAQGGWLTRYERDVAGQGRVPIIHQDPAVEARYPREMWAGNPILFPLISFNHLPDAENHYEWAGKRYPLPPHGFARRQPWRVIEHSSTAATVELADSEATRAVYPWSFRHQLTHRLDGGRLHVQHRITNAGTDPMPFCLGIHPYLRIPGPRSRSILRVAASTQVTPVDQARSYSPAPFNRSEVPLQNDFSGTLQLTDLVARECRLIDPVTRLAVVLNWEDAPGFRHVVFWSRTPEDPWICMEPWSALCNAYTRNVPGEVTVLAPGDSWSAAWWLDAAISTE